MGTGGREESVRLLITNHFLPPARLPSAVCLEVRDKVVHPEAGERHKVCCSDLAVLPGELSPAHVAHISRLAVTQVHAKSATETLERVPIAASSDIIAENRPVIRVSTILDNEPSTFGRFR